MLAEAYGNHAPSEATWKRWFSRNNDFVVWNEERRKPLNKFGGASNIGVSLINK